MKLKKSQLKLSMESKSKQRKKIVDDNEEIENIGGSERHFGHYNEYTGSSRWIRTSWENKLQG